MVFITSDKSFNILFTIYHLDDDDDNGWSFRPASSFPVPPPFTGVPKAYVSGGPGGFVRPASGGARKSSFPPPSMPQQAR